MPGIHPSRGPCSCSINSPSATIKSRKPAFVEIDPYNLTIKDEASIHQIETDLFFEGMSGSSGAEGPALYLLSSAPQAKGVLAGPFN
jgi:hypothetical protein